MKFDNDNAARESVSTSNHYHDLVMTLLVVMSPPTSDHDLRPRPRPPAARVLTDLRPPPSDLKPVAWAYVQCGISNQTSSFPFGRVS